MHVYRLFALLVWSASLVRGILITAQYDLISVNPNTGQKLVTHQFDIRCQLNDNVGSFLTYNVTWINNTITSTTIVITCHTPKYLYVISPALLFTPPMTGVVIGRVCNAVPTATGFLPTTLPVPPGTPVETPQSVDEIIASGRRVRYFMDYDANRAEQLNYTHAQFHPHPEQITHGPSIGHWHRHKQTLVGPAAGLSLTTKLSLAGAGIALLSATLRGTSAGRFIGELFTPLCWFASCNIPDLSAINSRLDNMLTQLNTLTQSYNQFFMAQVDFNEDVVTGLQIQDRFNQEVLRANAAQARQVQIVHEQVGILRTAVDILASNQIATALELHNELDYLQEEIQELVGVVDTINNVTQAQITQITDWVRNLVRINRMTQANLYNLRLQSSFKASVIDVFFAVFNQTNATFAQPYLSSWQFQPPNPQLANEYTTIDTLTLQYTYNAGADVTNPSFTSFAVNADYTMHCKNSFLLSFPRFAVSFIDLMDYFAPADCTDTIGTNNTCQCYWTVSATTATLQMGESLPPDNQPCVERSPRSFPYGFPPTRELSCLPFTNGGIPPCTDVNSFSDDYNENKDSEAGRSWNVGAYSVMDDATSAAQTVTEILENSPTTLLGALRKLCNQMVNGNVLSLLSTQFCDNSLPNPNSGGWSEACGPASSSLQPCLTSGPGASLVQFAYGPSQRVGYDVTKPTAPPTCVSLNPALCPYNLQSNPPNSTMRLYSHQSNTYWDFPSPATVSECLIDTTSLSFAAQLRTQTIGIYQVFLFGMQQSFNSFFDVFYPDLESAVTGIMPPDLAWNHELFIPDGTVNSAGCDSFTMLRVSSAEFWEPVRSLQQTGIQVRIDLEFFNTFTGEPVRRPDIFTEALPLVAFPLPTNILLAGPITFNHPESYTYDVSERDISVSNSKVSQEQTVSYAGLPPDAYNQALLDNIPYLALWKALFGDIWDPVAGGNALLNYLQLMTPWSPGLPQRCLQNRRLNNGICNIWDHYQLGPVNETDESINFFPWTSWFIDIGITLPTNEIFLETLSYCPQEVAPPIVTMVPPSPTDDVGFLIIQNPQEFNNQLTFSIIPAADPEHCLIRSNVRLTVPALGQSIITFTAGQGGGCTALQNLTLSLQGGSLCPGWYGFQANKIPFFTPGSVSPNVQSSTQVVVDAIMNGISNTELQLTNLAVQMALEAIQGPSAATFNRIYSLSNQTLAQIFGVQRNLTQEANDAFNEGFTNWDDLEKEFEEQEKIRQNASDAAQEAADQGKDNTEALLHSNAILRNLTEIIDRNTQALNESILALQEALRDFDNNDNSCGLLDFTCGSFWNKLKNAFVAIVILAAVGGTIYLIYYCTKDSGSKKSKTPSLSSMLGSSGGGSGGGTDGATVVVVNTAPPPSQTAMSTTASPVRDLPLSQIGSSPALPPAPLQATAPTSARRAPIAVSLHDVQRYPTLYDTLEGEAEESPPPSSPDSASGLMLEPGAKQGRRRTQRRSYRRTGRSSSSRG